MDLNMTGLFLHGSETLMSDSVRDSSRNNYLRDTALGLDCLGYGVSKATRTVHAQSNWDLLSSSQDDGCRLVLGLGPTPTSYCDVYFPAGVNKTKETMTLFGHNLVSESDSGMLELGLSRGSTDSILDVSQSNQTLSHLQTQSSAIPVADEGSTSAKRKSGGYMPSLLFAPRAESFSGSKGVPETQNLLDFGSNDNTCHDLHVSSEPSATTDCSPGGISDHTVAGAAAAADRRNHHHHPKKCRFKGCSKGARGASGLCISHGGGQRCQKPGCNKGAESRTAYCKAHGGGRRCEQLGCTKSAEGKTDHCIAHGGGRRCGHMGCTKAARGKSGLCIRHGGGKRCTMEGCTRSAEGQAGRCISHGGGRRCQYPNCGKGAQGSTMYCKAHGGGKRCIFEGCTKGAEGSTPLCKGHGGGKRCLFEGGGVCPKSVHGGTDYCVAHGGGKRCAVQGCTRSARGRTDCCVRHGGGKRCKFEGCGKSAQGSTDFCKAHGGGKRCTWGTGCEKFARGRSGLCAAHGSMMALQKEHNGAGQGSGSMIGPWLFRGIVSTSTTMGSHLEDECSLSGVSAISTSDCVDSMENSGRRQLIPPQVLVPLSMKFPSSSSCDVAGRDGEGGIRSQEKSMGFVISEGRVHGGALMSLLGGSFKNVIDNGLI